MTTKLINVAAAERIKLLGSRSFWWCSVIALLIVLAGALWVALDETVFARGATGAEFGFGGVPMVLIAAACAVTGEYRHRTIRIMFLAVPDRRAALLAKTGVVAVAAGLLGLLVGLGGHAVAAVRPDVGLALVAEADRRAVLGLALVYLGSAVFAVAVGTLLRHTAGAVAGLLVWMTVAEIVLLVLPAVGDRAARWLPFHNGLLFLYTERPMFDTGPLSGPWGSLAYFAGVAAVLLALALVAANRRDA